ncbi:hypothetical protein VPHK406_0013 [Vibrio phage K406]
MSDSRNEKFYVREGFILDEMSKDIFDEATHGIEKSANTKTSEFYIHLTTLSTMDKYSTYILSLNELEASFNISTDEIESITLRDTAVNKKLTFTREGGKLFYAKGQDTVGKNSEFDSLLSTEIVHSMNVNDEEYSKSDEGGFDLEALYLGLTGYDLSKRQVGEGENLGWWTFMGLETEG